MSRTPLSCGPTPSFQSGEIKSDSDWDGVGGWTQSSESVAMPKFNNELMRQRKDGADTYLGNMHFMSGDEWVGGQLHTPSDSFSSRAESASTPTAPPKHPMAYVQSLQDCLTRRGSSDELAASLESVGIGNNQYTLAPQQQGVDGGPTAAGGGSCTMLGGKKGDVAARRKRPRPAAIGTNGSSGRARSGPPSAMSPTMRTPSFGPGRSMRHSKSAQSLNSRHAGVRKASMMAPRSPHMIQPSSGKGEAPRRLRSSASTSTLVPGPMSAEDLSLLPSRSTMAAAAAAALGNKAPARAEPFYSEGVYSATPPAHVSLVSPPSTPLLHTPAFTYHQGIPPPMSAPPQFANFPDFSSNSLMGLNNWPEMASGNGNDGTVNNVGNISFSDSPSAKMAESTGMKLYLDEYEYAQQQDEEGGFLSQEFQPEYEFEQTGEF